MYLGTNQISKLYDHLQGYRMACMLHQLSPEADDKFFDEFDAFVYGYYEVAPYGNWKDIILEQSSGNEQQALVQFFELFDLFLKNTQRKPTKKIVLDFFDQVLQGTELKSRLGNSFDNIRQETINLVKEHLMSNRKSDYDDVLEQLELRAETIPELGIILAHITDGYQTG